MKNYNWGVIAPGKIANSFATALSAVDRATLYSVASRNESRANAFADKHGFETVATSYQELINDPKVDIIYIASPHNLHHEQSIACLQAGKAVMCEKPMTVNAIEAQQVLETAAKHNGFYMEAVWTRFLPIYQQIRAWLDQGKIGDVQLIQASFGFAFPFDPQSRLYDLNLAGGALLDMGIYPITFAQWVTNARPTDVSATGVLGETGVDESTSITLKYPPRENDSDSAKSIIATLNTTTNANTVYDAWIIGSKGRIKVPMFWRAESASLFVDSESNPRLDEPATDTVKIPHRVNGYEGEIIEAMRCLDIGLLESPALPWAESLAVMKIMDEVRAQIGLIYPFES